MPEVCLFEGQLISVNDIYKKNIDVSESVFKCINCNERLCFRKSRNGNKNYTEHFYHYNGDPGTHINCEKCAKEFSEKKMSAFHQKFSGFTKNDFKEILRTKDTITHIVDGYDKSKCIGIEYQNSKISCEDIKSRDNVSKLDWIFNVETQYTRIVEIGNKVICEIPHDNWEKALKVVKNKIFLYTGCYEWIMLFDRNAYHIESEGITRNVWIGEIVLFQDILNLTCLNTILKQSGKDHFNKLNNKLKLTRTINAKCSLSMNLLDNIHRNYVLSKNLSHNEILAIKSVAGSGKTTTLLNVAKKHKDKNILYLAFNKSLVSEIQSKIKKENIKNMKPFTFDKLMRQVYVDKFKEHPKIMDLKPYTIGTIVPWLKDKRYKIRDYYCHHFKKFCKNVDCTNIDDYMTMFIGDQKSLLSDMWKKSNNRRFATFDSIRKQSLVNNWLKDIIDNQYDMILIDEAQDFDMIMLRMILKDTTIPKVFVGDPLQSIYKFRGSINAFEHLPMNACIIEFYSTFRIGNPACDLIRNSFKDCWIISKSVNNTTLINDFDLHTRYTYLFRKWKTLYTVALTTKRIWINDYDNQFDRLLQMHKKLNDDEFEDDLPKFLKSLSYQELEDMLLTIQENIVDENECLVKFYIIHQYKGLETENIRIANDFCTSSQEEQNLKYVALTRGLKSIVLDK